MTPKNASGPWVVLATALAGVALLTTAAHAATSIYKTSNNVSQLGTGAVNLTLGEGNLGTLTIHTPVASRLAIFFNAECTTDRTSDTDFVDIDLRVDGVVIAPSSGLNAFCSGTGGGLDDWVTASVDGVVDVAAGTHTIQVRVDLITGLTGSGSQWRIDDLSLIVIVDELLP